MVSNRCKISSKEELKKLGLHLFVVDLEKWMMKTLQVQREQPKAGLLSSGLSLWMIKIHAHRKIKM
jgi:hypothetical protein